MYRRPRPRPPPRRVLLPRCQKPFEAGVDESKFFCGRKHKFGLNLQAICDHKKRFLYISVMYGASASDHIAFEVSELRQKLSLDGFLALALALYGDNAYVNTPFMATPYPNTGSNTAKDNYNFFHSQIRIVIEGVFGWLTQRWGMLRKQMPKKFSITKIVSVVSCLCRLHNFLIDENESVPRSHSEEDEWALTVGGAVPLAERNGVRNLPVRLMDVGHYHDDDPLRSRRVRASADMLPREEMFKKVLESNRRRPPRRVS